MVMYRRLDLYQSRSNAMESENKTEQLEPSKTGQEMDGIQPLLSEKPSRVYSIV